jgi:hypothetical protein
MLLTPVYIFEIVAMGCSLFMLHPLTIKRYFFLTLIMIITMIAETLGWYFHAVLHYPSNHFIYNFSVPGIILSFIYGFSKNTQYSKQILFIGILYLIIIMINFCFIQGVARFATYNYIVGGIALTLICTFYFMQLIKKPVLISPFQEPLFWVAAAILLMYLPKSVLYSAFEYLSYKKSLSVKFGEAFHSINTFLSLFFFFLLSMASVCRLIFRT